MYLRQHHIKMFNIVSWNCNSLLTVTHFFEINSFLASSSSPEILLHTEAKISENFIINDPNLYINYYNHFCFPYTRQSSGIVIYVKNHMNVYHEIITTTKITFIISINA
jgi:exonuclease III